MVLSADRKTDMRDGELIQVPVAANAVIYAGALVVATASGHAAPGSTAADLAALGKAEETVDNTGGANGDKTVLVRRKKAFRFKNDAGDGVISASLGRTVYIVDDETVARTYAGGTRSPAGVCVGIESDGVWVEIPGSWREMIP
jgi:hypothetical protein